MKITNQEQKLLTIIKYGPIIFILIISFLFNQQFISQYKTIHDAEISFIENKYIEQNRFIIKEEIEHLHKFISEEKETSLLTIKAILKDRVDNAHRIAYNLYTYYNKTKTKEELMTLIKESLRKIQFQHKNKYELFTKDGIDILSNSNNKNQNIINLPHNYKNGFIDSLDLTNKPEKITYTKLFKPYNFYISTGESLTFHDNELKTKILNFIQKLRYKNNSYVFVLENNGTCLAHYNKDYIGQNMLNLQDQNGQYIIKKILNFTKKETNGFISYILPTNINKNTSYTQKTSYVSLFKPWGWTIGIGFYFEDLQETLNQKKYILEKNNNETFYNMLQISAFLTIIFVLISFYISKILSKMFHQYRQNIRLESIETIKKEKLLIQQSKMATMGEMIGSIAHQWKQPLSVISMSNGLLRCNKENQGFLDEKEHNESLDNIDLSINNLSQTIDDFKNFFNPNKIKVTFKINEALIETIKLISSQFKNNDIEIIKEINDIELYGSQNELKQILINLLKNAKEALDEKGQDENKLIFITIKKNKKYIYIQVKDNANGIQTKIIDKVFNAYFTTKEHDGGTGIGLYITKQIVEMSFKGNISVSNVDYTYKEIKYKGVEFLISIPINQQNI